MSFADLKAIYSAPTIEEAELYLEAFETKWNASHPTIGMSWRNNGERITPQFSYPKEIRKAIYTTNAIESVNMSLRKVTKKRGSFPNVKTSATNCVKCVDATPLPLPGTDRNRR